MNNKNVPNEFNFVMFFTLYFVSYLVFFVPSYLKVDTPFLGMMATIPLGLGLALMGFNKVMDTTLLLSVTLTFLVTASQFSSVFGADIESEINLAFLKNITNFVTSVVFIYAFTRFLIWFNEGNEFGKKLVELTNKFKITAFKY